MKVAIIPARGGSRRIPRKNIRLFHGKPIIAYSIETAMQSGLFRAVWVSTDDDEIADVARQYHAAVMPRSAKLSRDDVGTLEVTRAAYLDIRQRYHEHITDVCCIYATAPLLGTSDLHRAYGEMRGHYTPHAFGVGLDPLRDAGAFYWSNSVALEFNVPLHKVAALIALPAHRVCDINTEDDWLRAERMYTELHKDCTHG